MNIDALSKIVLLFYTYPFATSPPDLFEHLGHFQPERLNISISHSFDKTCYFHRCSIIFIFISFSLKVYTYLPLA